MMSLPILTVYALLISRMQIQRCSEVTAGLRTRSNLAARRVSNQKFWSVTHPARRRLPLEIWWLRLTPAMLGRQALFSLARK